MEQIYCRAKEDSLRERPVFWQKLLKDKRVAIGFSLVAGIIFIALFAPLIAPYDPIEVHIENKLQPPSTQYWLGTDNLGRCIASRLIFGARSSLLYAGIILGLMLTISIPIGLLAGYVGGNIDAVIMRIIDICMAFPSAILALAVAGLFGASARNLVLALSCVWWAGYARLIRGMVLQMKEQGFILAALAAGCTRRRIVFCHLLRNVISPVIVLATLEVGSIILAIAGYSFIGLGAQPPTPEWGVMLSDSRSYMQTQLQLMIYPGVAIVVTVMAFNLLGEGLKDALER